MEHRSSDDFSALMLDELLGEAREIHDSTTALRHRLHRHPELGNDLPETRAAVLEALDGLPVEITLHESTSGVAALLTGAHPGPTVLLRGDMDALPLSEDTDVDYCSRVDGVMHACGHDTHTAMLVGAAKVLSARRNDLAGRVLFMFQPGEEGHHGARHMLDEGLLDVGDLSDGTASAVTGAFALHVTSAMPTGWVSTRGGPVMASSDSFSIRVVGRGGHASEPHRAADPIPVACEIVTALQSMITRRIDVFDPAVLTVARIAAGTTSNVIAECAEIEGTIRAVGESTRTAVREGVRRVAEGVGAAHGVDVDVEVVYGYPVTTNSDVFAEFSLGVATELLGDQVVHRLPTPVMGAEDFSYVLNEVPGTMMFLGATPHDRDPRAAAPNHSNRVFFDDRAMVTGVGLYCAMAVAHLSRS
jgi:hippurate hydrolase